MEKITAKQIGSNLNVMIEGTRYTKSKITKEEVTTIKAKIEMYNKKPSKAKQEEIIKMVSKAAIEKEKVEMVKKGIKKALKKETKKVSKNKAKNNSKTKDLVESVKTEFKEGNFS